MLAGKGRLEVLLGVLQLAVVVWIRMTEDRRQKTEDRRQKINMEWYSKTEKVPHGDILQEVMENAPYQTRDEFASKFVDTEEVPKAVNHTRSDRLYEKFGLEAVLYGMAKYNSDNGIRHTAIEVPDLKKYMDPKGEVSRREFEYYIDHFAYTSDGGSKLYNWEHRADLNQLRINNLSYEFDTRNGIIGRGEALRKGMYALGYRNPGKLYDDIMND